ncbi:PR domain zinc finger protein 8 isoform X2 [Pygocentrus nattereri]|nr:PR domain zinc finger protein 8 isoform X2 [Pygocentrus nattereri]
MSSGWMMITDMLPSIQTSYNVPAGAVFGPCDPQHTSLEDSIAFIALRCSDRRATAYTHQVDTSVPSVSVDCPVWLPLVRSARNTEEQNLEAYVKDSRLFYRALKNISKKTELLVWYGKDLAELLSMACMQKSSKGYRCFYCKQSFLFEFPVLAHQRFLCTERPTIFNSKSGFFEPSMEFHSLARNPENCPFKDSGSITKRRHSVDSESDESDEESLFSGVHALPPYKINCAMLLKRRFSSASSSQSGSSKISMTNEGGHSLHWATLCHANCHANLEALDSKAKKNPTRAQARGLQLTTTALHQEEKSAFVQPPRSTTNLAMTTRFSLGITSVQNATTFPSILTQAAAAKVTKPQALALLNGDLFKQQALVYESGLWSKHPTLLQAQSIPEWPLLPAALSPLGLPAQNWCAKCSISFHTTSDLVQHMRSHHKRSAEQLREHSEERLRCPICDEAFRERHHLSRHMSSHAEGTS